MRWRERERKREKAVRMREAGRRNKIIVRKLQENRSFSRYGGEGRIILKLIFE
jgi:hypothetical protein